MFNEISYAMIAGKPLLFWLGGIGAVLLISTVFTGMRALKGKAKMQHHKMLAIATLVIGIIHGVLAMGMYL